MHRIKHISLFFRLFFQLIFLVTPIFFLIGWYYAPASIHLLAGVIHINAIPHSYQGAQKILYALSNSDKLFGLGVSLIPLFIQLLIIYNLIILFKLFEQGKIFTLNNIRYIHNIGYALLLDQIINPFYQFFMGFVLTRHNPPGYRFAGVTLDGTNIGLILTALLVILISWIMIEGYKLHEEQQLTV